MRMRGLKDSTVVKWTGYAYRFLAHLRDRGLGSLAEVTVADVSEFLVWVAERHAASGMAGEFSMLKGVFFEVQVRSIFEESWLEFSHYILYPYDKDNEKKKAYVRILRDATSAADGLITFYDGSDPVWNNADAPMNVAAARAAATADDGLGRLVSEDLGTSNLADLLAVRY